MHDRAAATKPLQKIYMVQIIGTSFWQNTRLPRARFISQVGINTSFQLCIKGVRIWKKAMQRSVRSVQLVGTTYVT